MNYKKTYSVFLFLTCFLVSSYSIDYEYQYKQFTADDGLPSSSVFQVIKDKKGYIWAATSQGICQYDGYNFKYFNNEGEPGIKTVLEIYEDVAGRVWFIAMSGELYFFSNNKIKPYKYNNVITSYRDKINMPIKCSFYADEEMNVFIGFYSKPPIKISKDGKLKILESKHGFKYQIIKPMSDNRVIFSSKSTKNRLNFELVLDNKHIKVDANLKRNWYQRVAALYYKGKFIYSNESTLYIISENGHIDSLKYDSNIIWLSKDNKGNLVVSNVKTGIKIYQNFNLKSPIITLLKGKSVTSVHFDKNEGMLASTLKNGVFYFPSLSVKSLTTNQGLSNNNIQKILSTKNGVIIPGETPNLQTFDLKKISNLNIDFPEKVYSTSTLKNFGDTIFVSFHVYSNNSTSFLIKNNKTLDQIPGFYQDIIKLDDKRLIVFHNTAHIIEGETRTEFYRNSEYSRIYIAQKINNSTIVLGTNNGLYNLNLNKKEIIASKWKKLSKTIIISLFKDQDTLWVGTKGKGLFKIFNNNIIQYSKKDGITENSIYQIRKYKSSLWISSGKGLTKLTFNNQDSITKQKTFYSGNGLLSNESYCFDFYKNYVFVATKKGVSFFPDTLSSTNYPLYFTKLRIMGKDTTLMDSIVLPYNKNYIDISYKALKYNRNKPLRYEYKLSGLDKNWRKTKELSVQYPRLSPGNYNFILRSESESGEKSSETIQMKIVIKKAYYQTLWFKVIFSVSILLIFALISFIILRIKLKVAKQRSSLEKQVNMYRQQALSAQMNPHFIYNSLNSVQNYILKNDPIKSSEYLSMFGNLMRKILNNSQSPWIPLSEELEALQLYIKMEQIRFRNSFNSELNISKEINTHLIMVPPLILQPFVENAIHHGLRLKEGDKNMKIIITKYEDFTKISINDNGIGISVAKEIKRKSSNKYKSYGTEITSKRVSVFEELYGNAISINTQSSEEGTKVEIRIFNKHL